jgi:hypothetical protein
MMYRVTDPNHAYPIQTVEIEATCPQEAKTLTAQAMMGSTINDVCTGMIGQLIDDLICEPATMITIS